MDKIDQMLKDLESKIFSDNADRIFAKRQHQYWNGFKEKDLLKIVQKQINRCKKELTQTGMFAKDEDLKDLVWACVGRCSLKYDPAKPVKFTTYLHTAVDNAIKDMKNDIAKRMKGGSYGSEEKIFDHDYQIKIPVPHARFIDYLEEYTGQSKAEILRSIMCWAMFYLLESTQKAAVDFEEKYSPEIYSEVLHKFTEKYQPAKKTNKSRGFHFDGISALNKLLRQAKISPSKFMTAAIEFYLKGIQHTVDNEGLEAARDTALTMPLFREAMDIHFTNQLS